MFRRLTVAIAAVGLTLVGAPASVAAPPTTYTNHQHGVVETFRDVIPDCTGEGERYRITTTSNYVEHVTRFADGRIHVTFTATGRFVAEPLRDPDAPSYTGKFTIWGGFNENRKSSNGTFTFNIRGTGSDGSTFKVHLVDHFNERPDGTINAFFRCH